MSAWIVSATHITHVVDGAVRLGVIERKDAQKTGRMLSNANKRSIQARYGEWDEGARRVKTYNWWGSPKEPVSEVVLLKLVSCYSYQTCEVWGFEKTTAGRFVARMERRLAAMGVTRSSQGYDEAPWGI